MENGRQARSLSRKAPDAAARSEKIMSLKSFSELTQREILAIAIASEEEDNRIYSTFAEELADRYPATAKVFHEMAAEEDGHRRRLLEIYQARFGSNLPAIRREDVKGFYSRRPTWLVKNLPLDTIRHQAEAMEIDSQRFYVQAAAASQDVGVRKLLGDLAVVEKSHGEKANSLSEAILTESARAEEGRTAHKFFVLQYVQPGLAGLMDGSVSTLAPLFAAAFATQNNWSTFLVGLAASLGAGISMAIAEALSDDGSITGRGAPFIRGAVCGLMTAAGGLGHSLPFLVPDSWPHAFWTATSIAGIVVFIELWVIAYIRARYMDTPFLKAVAQIVVGGAVVLAVGILIGGA
jgi:rubrerythrin